MSNKTTDELETSSNKISQNKFGGCCFCAARTHVFCIFFLCSAVQGATWALIPSLPAVSAELFPGLQTSDLTWSMNANNLGQALAFPLATWILSQRMGLRWMMLTSFFTVLLQNAAWAAVAIAAQTSNGVNIWAVRICLIAGAFIGGTSSSLVQGAPSQLSAVWFQPAQRTRATAIAYSASFVGQTASLLLDLGINNALTLTILLLGQFALIALLAVISLFYFPGSPKGVRRVCQFTSRQDTTDNINDLDTKLLQPHADGSDELGAPAAPREDSAKANEASCRQLMRNIWRCISNPHCAALLVAGAVLNGFYNSWQSALPIFLDSNGTEFGTAWNASAAGGASIFKHTGDLFAFLSLLFYSLGGFIIGEIGDRCFVRRLKRLLVLVMVIATLNFAAMWLVLGVMPSYWGALACSGLTGLWSGCTLPLIMELLAELTYPMGAGVTANMSMLLCQFTATAYTAVIPYFSGQVMTAVVLGGGALSLLLVLPVRVKYRRHDTDA